MADIFISYARADREKVETLANVLQNEGLDVWWDRRIIGGDDFSAHIERELEIAAAVVVVWSETGSASHWVKDEAAFAAGAGKLITTSLDGSLPPMGFRQFHAIDLSHMTPYAAMLRFFLFRQRVTEDDLAIAHHALQLAVERAPKDANVRAALAFSYLDGFKIISRQSQTLFN